MESTQHQSGYPNELREYFNYLELRQCSSAALPLQTGGEAQPTAAVGAANLLPDPPFVTTRGSPSFTYARADSEHLAGENCTQCGIYCDNLNAYFFHVIDKHILSEDAYVCSIDHCYWRCNNFNELLMHSKVHYDKLDAVPAVDSPLWDLEFQYLCEYFVQQFDADPAMRGRHPLIAEFGELFAAWCERCSYYYTIHQNTKNNAHDPLPFSPFSPGSQASVLARTSERELRSILERRKINLSDYKALMAKRALYNWIQHEAVCRIHDIPQTPQPEGRASAMQGAATEASVGCSFPGIAASPPPESAGAFRPAVCGRKPSRAPGRHSSRCRIQPQSPSPQFPLDSPKPPQPLPPPHIRHPPTSPPLPKPLVLTARLVAHNGMVSPLSPPLAAAGGVSADQSAPAPAPKRFRKRRASRGARGGYPCTFCPTYFTNAANWKRHERANHVVLEVYVCGHSGERDPATGACHCCGAAAGMECLCREKALACAEREHEFRRGEHLLEHLKTHGISSIAKGQRTAVLESCRKVADPPLTSRCGFCNKVFDDWALRCTHIAAEFRRGQCMAQWTGDWGLDDDWMLQVQNNRNGCDVVPPQSRT